MNVNIRRATADDAETIAEHRWAMFADMSIETGFDNKKLNEKLNAMKTSFLAYLPAALEKEEYLGWLAEVDGQIVAGVGLIFYNLLPHPNYPSTRRPYLLNAYTEPTFRRQGIAQKIVKEIIDWCRNAGFSVVLLHPSEIGEKLYRSLGFEKTDEMRLKL